MQFAAVDEVLESLCLGISGEMRLRLYRCADARPASAACCASHRFVSSERVGGSPAGHSAVGRCLVKQLSMGSCVCLS